MAEIDQTAWCREVCRELMERRLKPYQAASVEGILGHFDRGHTRALLADEVGLGKTETAKGVIARMALAHWTNQQALPEERRRPFRAAYVCPNQSIARQNLRKLSLFSRETAMIRDMPGFLEELAGALGRYRSPEGLQRAWASGLELSVYTRLCQWLMGLYDGAVPDPADYPNDWKKSWSRLPEAARDRPAALRRDCLQAVGRHWDRSVQAVLEGFWRDTGDELKDYVRFNRLAAQYLSGLEEDRRLSMQHLYSQEDRLLRGNSLLQTDLITPRTSIYVRDKAGTKEERALLQASLERIYGGTARRELEAQLSRGVDGYGDLLAQFRNRIRCVEPSALPDREKLAACFRFGGPGGTEADLGALRRCFIEKNLETMRYDLVILDEFQNYTDILSAGRAGDSEAELIVGRLLGGEGTRVLMLSATPFSGAGGVLEGLEDPDDEGDGGRRETLLVPETFQRDWDRLREFMGGGSGSPAELGIFRTTREAASRHAPIVEAAVEGIPPDFAYALRLNRVDLERCRTAYGWTTPYALTFSCGYAFNSAGENELGNVRDPALFLTREDLERPKSIHGNHPAFDRLREELARTAGLLWIPPCNRSRPLGGPFRGLEGFSKTLVFCNYQMTPRAFAFLLSHEAYCRISPQAAARREEAESPALRRGVAAVLEELAGDLGGARYPQTRTALLRLFEELFCETPGGAAACARDAVERFYPEAPGYPEAVRQYCLDGCFSDMLREYLELLAAEYNGQDENMAGAVRRAGAFEQPETLLTLWSRERGGPENQEISPASRFAAGLYTKDGSGSLEGRLAEIKDAFNSPLQPFVFATTSIGTEGIDLHWYARNVVHWSVPPRPVDLEQREGRVLRYNCHAVRLNNALIEAGGITEADCLGPESCGNGMYRSQLNFFSDQERTDPAGEGCYHVRRLRYCMRFSPEEVRYEAARRAVREYRQVLDRLGAPGGERGEPSR